MQKYAAILHARKGEAPAVALACDAPFGPARQRAAERRGQRETPLSGAVGDDAHRVAAEFVPALEHTGRVARLGLHDPALTRRDLKRVARSEEHTSELQSLMRISYAVFCSKKKNKTETHANKHTLI